MGNLNVSSDFTRISSHKSTNCSFIFELAIANLQLHFYSQLRTKCDDSSASASSWGNTYVRDVASF